MAKACAGAGSAPTPDRSQTPPPRTVAPAHPGLSGFSSGDGRPISHWHDEPLQADRLVAIRLPRFKGRGAAELVRVRVCACACADCPQLGTGAWCSPCGSALASGPIWTRSGRMARKLPAARDEATLVGREE